MSPRALVLAAAVLVPAAMPALAAGAAGPQFLGNETIAGPAANTSGGQSAQDPVAAMDAAGDATVAYSLYDPAAHNWDLDVVTRPAGGAFGAPQVLDVGNNPYDGLRIAVGPNGDAAVAWFHNLRPTVAFRAAGAASFDPLVMLTEDLGEAIDVGVDGAGNVACAWIQTSPDDAASSATEATIRSKATGDWALPHKISGPADGVAPAGGVSVAVAPSGDALVDWLQGADYRGLAPYSARGSFRPAGQAFGGDVTIGAADQSQVYAAMGADGHAAAAWTAAGKAVAAVRPAGGPSFGSPAQAGAAGALGVAAGGDGTTDVLSDAAGGGLAVDVQPAGGSFPATPTILTTDALSRWAIAAGADGGALVTWFATRNSGGFHKLIGAATRQAGGSFAAAQPLVDIVSNNNDFVNYPATAVDGAGDGFVTWRRSDSAENEKIEVAPFDGAGPQLRGLTAPSELAAGAPGAFSFAPVDVWSPVASAGWSFGDTIASDLASTSHAYASSGAYTATAHATDALGNTSSATASIAVTAPSAPGGGSGPPVGPLPGTLPGPAAVGPPRLSKVSLSHKRFRVGAKRTALAAKATPTGTAFRYTLSAPATVTIAIARRTTGHRSGSRCVARGNGKRCKRTVAIGTLKRTASVAGARLVAFSGRLGRKALGAGRYIATLVATSAAGRSKAVTLAFTVVR